MTFQKVKILLSLNPMNPVKQLRSMTMTLNDAGAGDGVGVGDRVEAKSADEYDEYIESIDSLLDNYDYNDYQYIYNIIRFFICFIL